MTSWYGAGFEGEIRRSHAETCEQEMIQTSIVLSQGQTTAATTGLITPIVRNWLKCAYGVR
jgi:hypothetical protein